MERIWKKMIGALGFTLCMALAACSDYLDVSNEIAESLDLEAVFRNPAYTRQWHANLFNCISEYSCTGGNNASGFTNVWSSLCGETLISSGPSSRLMEAGYNSSNAPLHRWWVLYREIRDAFIFLKRVTPLGAVEDEQQLTEESVRRMKAEAKFLIAYSYFSLFELYGPVPLLTEEVDPESKDLNFPRATVDELVDYIDRLLEEVIQSGDLPPTLINAAIPDGNERYNLNEIVRPTRSAAIALRAKLWVYAASPLFNGGYAEALEVKNNDGEYLFPPYDPEKWKIAKKRLEEVLEDAEACGYRLYKVYQTDGSIDADRSVYEVFQAYNDEIIWATGRNYYHTGSQDGVMEENTTPRDLYKGWAHVCVTQESVDGFFMKDGLTIDLRRSSIRATIENVPIRISSRCMPTENLVSMLLSLMRGKAGIYSHVSIMTGEPVLQKGKEATTRLAIILETDICFISSRIVRLCTPVIISRNGHVRPSCSVWRIFIFIMRKSAMKLIPKTNVLLIIWIRYASVLGYLDIVSWQPPGKRIS